MGLLVMGSIYASRTDRNIDLTPLCFSNLALLHNLKSTAGLCSDVVHPVGLLAETRKFVSEGCVGIA